jgi:hypothetical protein
LHKEEADRKDSAHPSCMSYICPSPTRSPPQKLQTEVKEARPDGVYCNGV